jgi:hypothetical protein
MERARAGIAVAGAGLVAGFFLPWISADFGVGTFNASAYQMVTHWGAFDAAPFMTIMLVLVPVAGLAMLVTALTNSRLMRPISLLTGLGILGYGTFKLAQALFATSGWGIWIVVAAAVAAVVIPLASHAKK